MVAVIAIHCGAGSFKPKHHHNYKKLSKLACRRGNALLKAGKSAIDVVREVIKLLENNSLTNCGFGSNLTNTGTVETDASIMDGRSLTFGACGAVPNVKNPIQLAYQICINQNTTSPFGLVAPSVLVGRGALTFAKRTKLQIVKNKSLISVRALKQFEKYKKLVENSKETKQQQLYDTVGAVCIDLQGDVAAGCSSGGILLKNPGRVGQAAVYASGVWAENYAPQSSSSLAVCTSGCGEHLIRTHLAKVIADALQNSSAPTELLSQTISDKFLNSKYLQNVGGEKLCGALVLHANTQTGDVNILWGHSTAGMSVGYMTTNDSAPTALISQLPAEIQVGRSCVVAGTYVFNDKN